MVNRLLDVGFWAFFGDTNCYFKIGVLFVIFGL
jgi:hypothetical protein